MFTRLVEPRIVDGLAASRAVMIRGPRQAGKSTLAEAISKREGFSYFNLDEPDMLELAQSDPRGFIEGLAKPPAAIDEVQRVPELILAIKMVVDRDNERGRYLLTGSANYLTLPKVADSLAGRIFLYDLLPLSQREIESRPLDLITKLFEGDPPRPVETVIGPEAFVDRALAGGFPDVVLHPENTEGWFQSYVNTMVIKDLTEIARVHEPDEVKALLTLLAARSATTLNISGLSRDLAVPQTTIRRYLAMLQTLFLVERASVWRGNLGARIIKAPKLYSADTGLMVALLRATSQQIMSDSELKGKLFETFIFSELSKQLTWSEAYADLYHYRDQNKLEVDVIIERRGGDIVAIEAKSSASLGGRSAFRGLEHLRDKMGERFKAGYVIYTGEHILPFGDRLWSLPVSSLWS